MQAPKDATRPSDATVPISRNYTVDATGHHSGLFCYGDIHGSLCDHPTLPGLCWGFMLTNPTTAEEEALRSLPHQFFTLNRCGAPASRYSSISGRMQFSTPVNPFTILDKIPRIRLRPIDGPILMLPAPAMPVLPVLPPLPVQRLIDENRREAAEAHKWTDMVKLVKAGELDTLRKRQSAVETVSLPTAEWHYGRGGTGKTTAVRHLYPNAYLKDLTQWWDGYDPDNPGHSVVILDNVDSTYSIKGRTLFKELTDGGLYSARCKGGRVQVNIRKFIVVSAYHPNRIWRDHDTREAMLRRFKLVPYGDVTDMDKDMPYHSTTVAGKKRKAYVID